MAMKNRTCLACGTKYSFCPDCNGADKLKESWHSEFCSSECKDLWTTATKFNLGKLTKAEAKSIISALPLKPIDQYVKCVQRDLDVILKAEPKPKRGKRAENKSIIDEVAKPTIPVEVESIDVPVEDTTIHEVVNETIENE
jgi:hypothetical protein